MTARPQLDDSGWQLLLAALDADPTTAGKRYEELRARLLDTFRWKGFANAEELADRAFDRAARRLAEGEVIERGIAAYLTGIARKLVLEATREGARVAPLPDELATTTSDHDPQADRCVEGCLAEQPPGARDLLLRYLAGRGASKIAARRALADELGVNQNTLRIRVHRIRVAIEACLRECLGRNVSASTATREDP